MNKLILLLLLPCLAWAQPSKPLATIIPQPVSLQLLNGEFTFSSEVRIVDVTQKFSNDVELFNNQLRQVTGYTLASGNDQKGKRIIELVFGKQSNREGYQFSISKTKIQIIGDQQGVFYGLQSLLQVVSSNYVKGAESVKLPCVAVEDYPRYSWRGMHLDVCRHFFTKEEVKRYIDFLALYKMNVFHWHLTEDQGWRIEIKKYPLLTEVGSKRKGTIVGLYSKDAPLDNVPHQGYYTQEDIREVVEYAAKRYITVVPEIEMPGHALAALASYPQLSCTGGPFEPATTWGVFDDVFCAGNEETFKFFEDVLTEVSELFPSSYIHIGGDECPKARWKSCVKCQDRIRTENLKDEHELQSYFIKRIEKFLQTKNKKIIGWDEILEGGLAPNASVMSWRGTAGGIDAARQQHTAVMSPNSPCYFDHYQSKEKGEPLAIGGFNPLQSVYDYEPTPSELAVDERKYILGAQANLWTEYITTFSHVEYMAMPRMSALAETLWTPAENKNYADYIIRLKSHSKLLDALHVNYAKHFLSTP